MTSHLKVAKIQIRKLFSLKVIANEGRNKNIEKVKI